MQRQILIATFAAAMLVLGTTTKARAWGAYHAGYTHVGYGGAYHVGYTGGYGGYHGYGGYGGVRTTTVSDNSVTRTGYGYGGAYGYHSYNGAYGGSYACGGYHYGGAYGGGYGGYYRRW